MKADPKEDPCQILSDLLYAILNKGSKDNMTALIVELKDGTSWNKHKQQFFVGEFYERGNPTFIECYKSFCEKNGKDFNEAQQEWKKKEAEIQKREAALKPPAPPTLQELVDKLCKTDTVAATALREAFMSAENSTKLKKPKTTEKV